MRGVPFLYLSQAGGAGGLSTISIRGGKPNFTLVLIDGIPVNDITNILGGSFDFSGLATDNLEQVEIVRGPLSSIYGSDAIGAVINFISRRGEKASPLEVGAEFGTFAARQIRIASNERWKWLGYSFNASYLDVGEQVYRDPYSLGTLAVHATIAAARDRVLEIVARYQEKHSAGLPPNGGGPEFSILRDAMDDRTSELILGASYKAQVRPWWNYSIDLDRFGSQETKFTPAILDGVRPGRRALPSSRSATDFNRTRLGLSSSFALGSNLSAYLSAGVHDEAGTTSGKLADIIPSSFQEQRWGLVSTAELVYSSRRFTATAGLSLDKREGYGVVPSPRVGINYSLSERGPRLKASWAEGFKLPSFYAQSDPNVGNPSLKPERSRAFDFGIEQRIGQRGALVSVTYFRNRFTDLVDFSAEAFRLVNRSRALTQGVELGAESPSIAGFQFGATYSYLEWELKDSTEPLRDVPRWTGGVHLQWTGERLRARIETNWIARRFDYAVPVPEQATVGGYSNTNAALTYQLTKQVSLYFRADNLWNSQYHDLVGFPNPGLSARVGIGYQLFGP